MAKKQKAKIKRSVYSTPAIISVKPNYHIEISYKLFEEDGRYLGEFTEETLPEDIVIVNCIESLGTNIFRYIKPIAKYLNVYENFREGRIFNGYFYIQYDYNSNYDYDLERGYNFKLPMSIIREINRPFFAKMKFPEPEIVHDWEFVGFRSISDKLWGDVLYFKDKNEGIFISGLNYITMLLEGEAIKDIYPDSDYLVDVKNIITPKGNLDLNIAEVYPYNRTSDYINEYINAVLWENSRIIENTPDLVEIVPENSLRNRCKYGSDIFNFNEIHLTEVQHLTKQVVEELFNHEKIYLSEDYNIPLFNIYRYGIDAFPSNTKNYFIDVHHPLLCRVLDTTVVDDTEGVLLEFNGIKYEYSFYDIADYIYDLYYETPELKEKVLTSYEEFLSIAKLLDSSPLTNIEIVNLRLGEYHNSKLPYATYMTTVFKASYGNIYLAQIDTTSMWYNLDIKIADSVYYNVVYGLKINEPARNLNATHLSIEGANNAFGSIDRLLYMDIFDIKETETGVEIQLLVAVTKKRTPKALYNSTFYVTNLLVSDLPWVKVGDKYLFHTVFRDFILDEEVFNHLSFDYTLARLVSRREEATEFYNINRDSIQDLVKQLCEEYGELPILGFDIE